MEWNHHSIQLNELRCLLFWIVKSIALTYLLVDNCFVIDFNRICRNASTFEWSSLNTKQQWLASFRRKDKHNAAGFPQPFPFLPCIANFKWREIRKVLWKFEHPCTLSYPFEHFNRNCSLCRHRMQWSLCWLSKILSRTLSLFIAVTVQLISKQNPSKQNKWQRLCSFRTPPAFPSSHLQMLLASLLCLCLCCWYI